MEHQRIPLVLIIDPRFPVHARTGFLPEKAIGLAPEHFRHALEHMGLILNCGPILLPGNDIWPLTLPEITGHTWQWAPEQVEQPAPIWQPVREPSGPMFEGEPPVLVHDAWLSLIRSEPKN